MRKLLAHLLLASSLLAPLAAQSEASPEADYVITSGLTLCYVAHRGMTAERAFNFLASRFGNSTALARLDDPYWRNLSLQYLRALDTNCDPIDHKVDQFIRNNPNL